MFCTFIGTVGAIFANFLLFLFSLYVMIKSGFNFAAASTSSGSIFLILVIFKYFELGKTLVIAIGLMPNFLKLP
ncbi:Uncharacterised protein [Staphylococcus aureus]|nr:Uncharacterised protein [Staphylococcus aureus]